MTFDWTAPGAPHHGPRHDGAQSDEPVPSPDAARDAASASPTSSEQPAPSGAGVTFPPVGGPSNVGARPPATPFDTRTPAALPGGDASPPPGGQPVSPGFPTSGGWPAGDRDWTGSGYAAARTPADPTQQVPVEPAGPPTEQVPTGWPGPWGPPPAGGAPGGWHGGWPPPAPPGGPGGYGWYGPPGGGGGWPPAPPQPTRGHRGLAALILAVAVIVAASGFLVGKLTTANTASNTPTSSPSTGQNPGSSANPFGSGGGGTGSGNGVNADAVAAKVDPGLVDVNTVLADNQGEAAGTGLVLTANGEILTNNHVVKGASQISVTDVGNQHTYNATVVGTDATDDVAVLQLQGASGLATVTIASADNVTVGTPVVAIGNAGGVGGTPSVATGTVTALDQSITAADESTGLSEQLSGLIETDADIQPGDSGGPLVNENGDVIGMDTAASQGFEFSQGTNQGYAIPVERAITVAKEIEAGRASTTVHIGASGILGVEVSGSGGSGTGSGAVVEGVEAGSPAADAGIVAGDVIDSINGQDVTSAQDLTTLMFPFHPGDHVTVGWEDTSGQQQTATVTLETGPAN